MVLFLEGFFLSLSVEKELDLFLSNSSTNWIFCIMVLYLTIAVKVNKFRQKGKTTTLRDD